MKKYIAIASFSGAISVVLGAFAAHGLKNRLSLPALSSFETGVKYQIIHSLFLFLVMVLPVLTKTQQKMVANVLVTGIICFSGSIYLLTLNIVPAKFIWFITPLGGLLLTLAWLLTAIFALKQK